MKSKTLIGKILEIIIKGTAFLIALPLALIIEIVHYCVFGFKEGFQSLINEFLIVIDGWFQKGVIQAELVEKDITPIVAAGVLDILDKMKSVAEIHAIYSDKDVEQDIDKIVKSIKEL